MTGRRGSGPAGRVGQTTGATISGSVRTWKMRIRAPSWRKSLAVAIWGANPRELGTSMKRATRARSTSSSTPSLRGICGRWQLDGARRARNSGVMAAFQSAAEGILGAGGGISSISCGVRIGRLSGSTAAVASVMPMNP
ncbi:hypothetical protein HS125_09330 [bacterium]|nr:hypothetical protein [bacterium]